MKKAILLFLICSNYLHSQTQSESNTIYSDTPGRIFDTLLDRDNNKYPINNLRIIGSGGSISSAPSLSCNAGYFTLYFVNPATNPTMMNVACQLFTDISCLITSPLSSACHNTTNTATRVNIKVDVITFTNSVLGNAGGYFAVPLNPTSTSPGITDNMIYKTITSGVDAYYG